MMYDYHLIGALPVPPEYPAYQPYAANETHWAGLWRGVGERPVPAEVLAKIETEGESTFNAMLASLSPEQLARFRAVHPEFVEVLDREGDVAMVATGPIVTFAGDKFDTA